jgi:hypothetical protein
MELSNFLDHSFDIFYNNRLWINNSSNIKFYSVIYFYFYTFKIENNRLFSSDAKYNALKQDYKDLETKKLLHKTNPKLNFKTNVGKRDDWHDRSSLL